jgi:periplasmic protein TonB
METRIAPADRLGLTLFLAFTLHAVLILGTAFQAEPPRRLPPPDQVLEITVVRHPQPAPKPKDPDFLAQTSQEGGGSEAERMRPTTQEPAPRPTETPVEQPPLPPVEPQPGAAPTAEALPAETPPPPAAPETPIEPVPSPAPAAPAPVIAAPKPAPAKVEKRPEPPKPERKKEPPPKAEETATAEAPKPTTLSAAAILAQTSAEIERLSAELDRKTEAYAKTPRRKFISASTAEYLYATYHEAWRKKVEQIGNLNYPEEARRQGLFGSLILEVTLRPDGHVESIEVRRSSGHKVLDDAARRIVEFSAPFAPFPPEMRKETDLLVITRTWQFLPSNRLFAQ